MQKKRTIIHNPKYDDKRWVAKRKRIMRDAGYKCKLCSRYGRSIEAKLVHHIYPLDEYPQYFLCDWNLIPLCYKCHAQMHNRDTNALTVKGKELKNRTIPPLEDEKL